VIGLSTRNLLSGVLIGLGIVLPFVAFDDETQHPFASILPLSALLALAGLTLHLRRWPARGGFAGPRTIGSKSSTTRAR
jgi:hypothetical protein